MYEFRVCKTNMDLVLKMLIWWPRYHGSDVRHDILYIIVLLKN